MSGGIDDPALDCDLRAGAYVLGTLDPEERAAMACALTTQTAIAARVRAWERRFSPLLSAIPPVVPSPGVRVALLQALSIGPNRAADLLAHDPLVLLCRKVRR